MILPNNKSANDNKVNYGNSIVNENDHNNNTSDDYSEDDSNDYGKNNNNCYIIGDSNNEDEDSDYIKEVNYADLPKMSNEPKINNVLRLLRADEDENILGKIHFILVMFDIIL
jgi:hypothetical protein